MRVGMLAVVYGLLGLAGCSANSFDGLTSASATQANEGLTGTRLSGAVHGGQQPIAGAKVYLLAASATGYGGLGIVASASNASVSLLTGGSGATLDSNGGATNGDYFVTTDSNGNFSITGDYACTVGQQVYLYALGGNPGAGVNSAAGLMTALGACPAVGNFLTATPYIAINEVSTVAAAYAFAGFATDATHVGSSGTALASTGIANAFANAANLETLETGVALAAIPAGNGTVPQAEINTLADILAACVNSTGVVTGPTNATPCYTLFTNALSAGTMGTQPTDTATAAINIAHNPELNIGNLYGLTSGTPPFAPVLTAQPNDFTVALNYAERFAGTSNIAMDGSGNAWIAVSQLDEVFEFSSKGALLSGANGYTGGGMAGPNAIAIDSLGNAWITNFGGYSALSPSITEISASGSILSGSNGYTGGGLHEPIGIAIDGTGNVWTQAYGGWHLFEFSGSGSPLSGADGYSGSGLDGPTAIDSSGDVWIASNFGYSVIKLSNTGSILSSGYPVANLPEPAGIAIDSSGHVWITDVVSGIVAELSSSGSPISGTDGYAIGGLVGPGPIAIDGAGNAWITSYTSSRVAELSNAGSTISGANGYVGGGLFAPVSIAIDGSGDVWVANNSGCVVDTCNSSTPDNGSITEFIGAAVPVTTPLAVGVKNNTLGTRP